MPRPGRRAYDPRRPRSEGDRMATYLVTGASGFLGGELVGRLLERDGSQLHALVRPTSQSRLAQKLRKWPRAADVEPEVGDLVRAAARPVARIDRAADRHRRPPRAPRGRLRHDRRRRRERGGQRRRDHERRRARQPARGRVPAPRVVGRGRGGVPRPLHRGDVRRGPAPARRRTTGRSTRPSASCASRRRCRGGCTGPRSSSATRAPGSSTRSTARTTCSSSSAGWRCCRAGCGSRVPTSARPTWCPSTTWSTRWTTSCTPTISTVVRSTS